MPARTKGKHRRSAAFFDVGERGRATGVAVKGVRRDSDHLAGVRDFFESDPESVNATEDEFDDKLEDSVMPAPPSDDDDGPQFEEFDAAAADGPADESFSAPTPVATKSPASAASSARTVTKTAGSRRSSRSASKSSAPTPPQTTPVRAIDFAAAEASDSPRKVHTPAEATTPKFMSEERAGPASHRSIPEDPTEDSFEDPESSFGQVSFRDPTPARKSTAKKAGKGKAGKSPADAAASAKKSPAKSQSKAGKQKGSKAKASRPKSAKQTPANRSRPALAKIGMTPAYEEDDEGVRRSTRNRLTPCKYWKNERVEYEKQPGGLFKVVTKVKPETPPVKPRAQSKRKLGGRQDERKRPRTIPEEDEYKEDLPDVPDTEPIMVRDWSDEPGEDFELMLAKTRDMLELREVGSRSQEGPKLRMCKAFNVTEERWAAGLLEVPARGSKPTQTTKTNFLVFYVAGPAIEVTIHENTSMLNSGSMFFVPPGNTYSLRNPTEHDCKLTFMQVKV